MALQFPLIFVVGSSTLFTLLQQVIGFYARSLLWSRTIPNYKTCMEATTSLYWVNWIKTWPTRLVQTLQGIKSFRSGQFVKLSFIIKMSGVIFFHGKFGRALNDFKRGHWWPGFKGPVDKELMKFKIVT